MKRLAVCRSLVTLAALGASADDIGGADTLLCSGQASFTSATEDHSLVVFAACTPAP